MRETDEQRRLAAVVTSPLKEEENDFLAMIEERSGFDDEKTASR